MYFTYINTRPPLTAPHLFICPKILNFGLSAAHIFCQLEYTLAVFLLINSFLCPRKASVWTSQVYIYISLIYINHRPSLYIRVCIWIINNKINAFQLIIFLKSVTLLFLCISTAQNNAHIFVLCLMNDYYYSSYYYYDRNIIHAAKKYKICRKKIDWRSVYMYEYNNKTSHHPL